MRIASRSWITNCKILANSGIRAQDLPHPKRKRYHWATRSDVCRVVKRLPGFNRMPYFRNLSVERGRCSKILCRELHFVNSLQTANFLIGQTAKRYNHFIKMTKINDKLFATSTTTRWNFIHSTDISPRNSVVIRFVNGRSWVRIPQWEILFHFVILARLAFFTALVSPCKWNKPWYTPSQYHVLDKVSIEKNMAVVCSSISLFMSALNIGKYVRTNRGRWHFVYTYSRREELLISLFKQYTRIFFEPRPSRPSKTGYNPNDN